MYLVSDGGDYWGVYTVDFYNKVERKVKATLQANWQPMFPSETPDGDEDSELFKAVVAKSLLPIEISIDPSFYNPWLPKCTLKRKRNPDEETDPEEPYDVPQVSYSGSDHKLVDKERWLKTRAKEELPKELSGKERAKLRKKINYLESSAYKRQQDGEILTPDNLKVQALRISSTGWMGRSFPVRSGEAILRGWNEGRIHKVVRGFLRVPFDKKFTGGTFITDSAGRLCIYRSSPGRKASRKLHGEFVKEAERFVKRCTPEREADIAGNARGQHWFCIAGYDRQNKDAPALRPWHVQNKEIIEEFFGPGTAFSRVTALVNDLLKMHFPKIAARYAENIKDTNEKYKNVKPHFDLFWNFCLNYAPHGDVPRVHCLPHIDSKNIAIGICALYIYGHFNFKEVSWLCIWEAGIIIQLPPGVILLYPSALFYHFNIDMNVDIRVTQDGSQPTPSSPKLGQTGKGRGSCVYFCQASMFQVAKVKYHTLEQARKARPNFDYNCNNEELLKDNGFPTILDLEELLAGEKEQGPVADQL